MSQEIQPSKTIVDLVNRAAVLSDYDPNEHKTNSEKYQENLKEQIAEELENLDLAVLFTQMLIEKNHPDPTRWIIDVISEEPIREKGSWRKQIHQFATRWITHLALIQTETLNTETVRSFLANESEPFIWLGYVETKLVPLIVKNKLFMTEEQAQSFLVADVQPTTDEEVVVYEITQEGAVQVEATAEDVAFVAQKS